MRNSILYILLLAGGAFQLSAGAAESAAEPAPPVSASAGAAAAPLIKAYEEFGRGGAVMWVLLALSVAGGAFAAERCLVLRRERQLPGGLMLRIRAALSEGGVAQARASLEGDGSTLARIMSAVLLRSGATRRELETAVDDEAGRVYGELRDNLRPVGLTASLAPSLGLLGTVLGLIGAFRQAAELGMDDPRNFAGGIYEALYTTAFGLVIAIPFLVIHHSLKGRAEKMVREAEAEAIAFVLAATMRRSGGGKPEASDQAA